jgi:hypothetical protein
MPMNLGSLGGLFIDLAANTGKFETDLGRAAKLSEQRSREIQKGFQDAAKNIAGALAAIDIGGRFAAGFNKAIERADALDEMAQKVGATVRGLSQLQFAAELEGIEDFTQVMVKLNRATIEAKTATSEQAKAFEALGVSTLDASGNLKSSDALLIEIAESFSRAEDGANKTAIAMALFGKTGADLIPFLNNGAAGIKRLTDVSDQLGLTLDESTAAAAAKFNDNLFIIGKSSDALFTKVTAQLLPGMADLAEQFKEVSKDGAVVATIADGIRVGFQGVALLVANVGYVFAGIGREIGGIAAQAVALGQLDFAGAAAIHDAMVADAELAKQRVDQLNAAILNLGRTNDSVPLTTGSAATPGPDAPKCALSFGTPEAKPFAFTGSFDPAAIQADALRGLEEQIQREGVLLEQAGAQWLDYYDSQLEGELRMQETRERIAKRQVEYIEGTTEQQRAYGEFMQQQQFANIDIAQQGLAVLQMVQGQSKQFQIGMLIAQNALAAASIYANTQIAAAQALALYGPAGPAAAAAIEARGAISLALVGAATAIGIAQISGSRRYGGAVQAGGMYEVAEPGNPELLRYGNKTMLLMGQQSGVVEPAMRADSPGMSVRSGMSAMRITSDLGFPVQAVPFVTGDELQLRLRYTESAAVASSQRAMARDQELGGPITQQRRAMERTANRPMRR